MRTRQIIVATILGVGGLVLSFALWPSGGPAVSRNAMGGKLGQSSPPAAPSRDPREHRPSGAFPALRKAGPNELAGTPGLRALALDLESLRNSSDSLEKGAKLESWANEIPTNDIPAAIEFLMQRGTPNLYRDAGERLIRRWAEIEPHSAAEWVARELKGPERQPAINHVAVVWANQNLPDAVGWVRQLTDPAEQQSGLLAAAYEAARTKPIEALKLAVELPANESRNDLITHTTSQWAATNPEAAAAWAHEIADAELRDRVLSSVTTTWGASDPVSAANWAVKSLSPGRHQDDAVVGIVQQWVQKEPQDAAAWVLAFPSGTLRDIAIENVVKLWADKNLEQTGKWLEGLEAGASRDAGVSAYVNKVAPLFPEVAAGWAEAIGEEVARNHQMEAVGESWMASDAPAAKLWVEQAPFPEKIRARLLALDKQ